MDTYTLPEDQGQPIVLTAAFTGHVVTCMEEHECYDSDTVTFLFPYL